MNEQWAQQNIGLSLSFGFTGGSDTTNHDRRPPSVASPSPVTAGPCTRLPISCLQPGRLKANGIEGTAAAILIHSVDDERHQVRVLCLLCSPRFSLGFKADRTSPPAPLRRMERLTVSAAKKRIPKRPPMVSAVAAASGAGAFSPLLLPPLLPRFSLVLLASPFLCRPSSFLA
jgi:hypothetical protein